MSEIDGGMEVETIFHTLTVWCCSCNSVVQWYGYIILSFRQFYRNILSVISMWNRYDVPTCQFWASEINPVLNILSSRLKMFRNHQYTGDRREWSNEAAFLSLLQHWQSCTVSQVNTSATLSLAAATTLSSLVRMLLNCMEEYISSSTLKYHFYIIFPAFTQPCYAVM